MSLFTPTERTFATTISQIAHSNPFLPDRIALERQALGPAFIEPDSQWNRRPQSLGLHDNVTRLADLSTSLADAARSRFTHGARASDSELVLYQDLCLFALYHQYFQQLSTFIERNAQPPAPPQRVPFYRAFAAQVAHYFDLPDRTLPIQETPQHLFAIFFQIRRAFLHIFSCIVGGSQPACQLRAAVWQSIFTHDLGRYRRSLHQRMGDITTLITGPSGTGKELVAQAIGFSRYIPFDARSHMFIENFAGSFHALSLSALSPTLIESELFGHRRGSFTGALDDRTGWLETCSLLGTVFLDEVGEIDPLIQVKLLRVLQTRSFQRLGDTQPQRFLGKIIAATNRDLALEMRQGRFREDFYYRLCSDLITTPSLHELLNGSQQELHDLILFIAQRIAGDEAEALSEEVFQWIGGNLGHDYPWPGNFRELEQCVRNVLVRGVYRPAQPHQDSADDPAILLQNLQAGELTADQLLQRYCTLVYTQTGTYEETARRLGIDRRTVKTKLRPSVAGSP